MPSIEIVSIDSENSLYKEGNYQFAIQFENGKIESHRSLFFDFLKDFNGTIIHLGNPEFKESLNECLFAGKLIDWEIKLKNDFKFLEVFENDFKNLLKLSQDNSSIKTVYFLTDYQFSRRKPKMLENYNMKKFLGLYETKGLEFNRIYKITN